MFIGEYASMTAIHTALPHFAPVPIVWRTYASDPNVDFFLCSFHNISVPELLNIKQFSAHVAELHKNGKSPNGKHGFPVTAFQGNLSQDNT